MFVGTGFCGFNFLWVSGKSPAFDLLTIGGGSRNLRTLREHEAGGSSTERGGSRGRRRLHRFGVGRRRFRHLGVGAIRFGSSGRFFTRSRPELIDGHEGRLLLTARRGALVLEIVVNHVGGRRKEMMLGLN